MRIRLIGMIYAVGVALAAWHVPVAAQEKTATKADFLLKPGSARLILIYVNLSGRCANCNLKTAGTANLPGRNARIQACPPRIKVKHALR